MFALLSLLFSFSLSFVRQHILVIFCASCFSLLVYFVLSVPHSALLTLPLSLYSSFRDFLAFSFHFSALFPSLRISFSHSSSLISFSFSSFFSLLLLFFAPFLPPPRRIYSIFSSFRHLTSFSTPFSRL